MSDRFAGDDFFKVGGTLSANAPSYVTRQADRELLQAVLAGQYCNVLMARQMGKSSLMVRTRRRLQEDGINTVVIDLDSLGKTGVSADQWYLGLIIRMKRHLSLSVDEAVWWRERHQLGPVQRFSDFLRQVVLEQVQGPTVIFVDEIDSTLNLTFTDDFFAAIRFAYNARASEPAFKRLTFVLLGVALPLDLVKDLRHAPYNIGTDINICDFTAQEARGLLTGLEPVYGGRADTILQRVLYWTDGHPYLTQKVCAEVMAGGGRWTDARIDALVERLFLAEEARKETNLQFIRDWIRESDERAEMLEVYRQIRAGRRVMDDKRSLIKSQLRLTGLVKIRPDSTLIVRNRIYAQVFDDAWIKENFQVSPAPSERAQEKSQTSLQWVVVAIIVIMIVAFLALFLMDIF
jgi:hypothetical protein